MSGRSIFSGNSSSFAIYANATSNKERCVIYINSEFAARPTSFWPYLSYRYPIGRWRSVHGDLSERATQSFPSS